MTDAAYFHEYYIEHRDKLLEQAKRWGKDNRLRVNANRRYRYRVDDEYREHERERARKRAAK